MKYFNMFVGLLCFMMALIKVDTITTNNLIILVGLSLVNFMFALRQEKNN